MKKRKKHYLLLSLLMAGIFLGSSFCTGQQTSEIASDTAAIEIETIEKVWDFMVALFESYK